LKEGLRDPSFLFPGNRIHSITFVPMKLLSVFLIGISGGEIIVVFLFILIFFGADKIPGFARTMGRTIRQVKDATSDIQRDIQNSVRDVKDEAKKTEISVRKTLDQIHEDDKKE
jgi:TatA/E family protein of Tat protein translocase